ncbi:uncharacterized protein [Aegilops tauschii subsp. strangulata]|uniref:uncharacterized protein n=1 Tax=Aegilops tauschii subsp. strangulata TaxID=200361 RepID=UPI003CC84F9F
MAPDRANEASPRPDPPPLQRAFRIHTVVELDPRLVVRPHLPPQPRHGLLQCVAALVLGAAVLLSALFWLPPFAGRGRRGPTPGTQDPFTDGFIDDIVASFRLQKNVPSSGETCPSSYWTSVRKLVSLTPLSSKEMTAMFSFGLVLLEIITGKRAVLSNEPDEDEETLVSWVGLSQVPWSPPPLVRLGAKSEELLFASPRLAQATSSGACAITCSPIEDPCESSRESTP